MPTTQADWLLGRKPPEHDVSVVKTWHWRKRDTHRAKCVCGWRGRDHMIRANATDEGQRHIREVA